MAIENSVSNDFLSTFVDSINVFDCCQSGVKMKDYVLWILHLFTRFCYTKTPAYNLVPIKMSLFSNQRKISVWCELSWSMQYGPGPVAQSFQRIRDWAWNIFCGHSPPSADSRRAVVSYKQKYVHWVLVNCLGLSLPRNVVFLGLTVRFDMTISVD